MIVREGIQLLACEKCKELHRFPSKPGVKLQFEDETQTIFNWKCHYCSHNQSSNVADFISVDDLPILNL